MTLLNEEERARSFERMRAHVEELELNQKQARNEALEEAAQYLETTGSWREGEAVRKLKTP